MLILLRMLELIYLKNLRRSPVFAPGLYKSRVGRKDEGDAGGLKHKTLCVLKDIGTKKLA